MRVLTSCLMCVLRWMCRRWEVSPHKQVEVQVQVQVQGLAPNLVQQGGCWRIGSLGYVVWG